MKYELRSVPKMGHIFDRFNETNGSCESKGQKEEFLQRRKFVLLDRRSSHNQTS